MLVKLKRATAALVIACLLAIPVCAWATGIVIYFLTHVNEIGEGELLLPGLLLANVIAYTIYGLLIYGIYRKNRFALALAIVVYPVTTCFGLGLIQSTHQLLHLVLACFVMALAAVVAAVYIREFVRSWHRGP